MASRLPVRLPAAEIRGDQIYRNTLVTLSPSPLS